jgi:hypothetical protein
LETADESLPEDYLQQSAMRLNFEVEWVRLRAAYATARDFSKVGIAAR